MRFITFKTLTGKNFLSFGNDPVEINLQPGVNAITGINLDKEDSKNGAGKSCITELLYYALYGTTLREISKDHIQNTITKKRTEVTLTFDIKVNGLVDTCKIVRQLNPTKCSLYLNGENLTRSTLAKTNALIQSMIHTPATVFQNSVIMSVNNALPFMALSKTDKRKFIESVLGLEVFTSMVLKARDDYSIAKKDYEIAYTKLDQIKAELTFNESQLKNYETLKKEQLAKLQVKIEKIESDIKTIKDKKKKEKQIKSKHKEICAINDKLLKKHTDAKTKVGELDFKIQISKKQLPVYEKDLEDLSKKIDVCPTCNRPLEESHEHDTAAAIAEKKKKIQETITSTKSEIKSFTKDKATLLKEASKIEKELGKIQPAKQKLENFLQECKTLAVSLSHLEQNLKETKEEQRAAKKQENNDLKGKVASLKEAAKEGESRVNKYNNELNILETVKFVISEEGIKSYIVKKILKVLNARLAYYLKKLEANCLCSFNEYFEEEIIDETSHPKSYFNFSGGERKRIDLACLFAFADIRRLQGDVNFSTVFYDELLDSSLDDKGVSLALKVLRERYQENAESCYIITHRGPEVLSKAEHVIQVVKQNGISVVSS